MTDVMDVEPDWDSQAFVSPNQHNDPESMMFVVEETQFQLPASTTHLSESTSDQRADIVQYQRASRSPLETITEGTEISADSPPKMFAVDRGKLDPALNFSFKNNPNQLKPKTLHGRPSLQRQPFPEAGPSSTKLVTDLKKVEKDNAGSSEEHHKDTTSTSVTTEAQKNDIDNVVMTSAQQEYPVPVGNASFLQDEAKHNLINSGTVRQVLDDSTKSQSPCRKLISHSSTTGLNAVQRPVLQSVAPSIDHITRPLTGISGCTQEPKCERVSLQQDSDNSIQNVLVSYRAESDLSPDNPPFQEALNSLASPMHVSLQRPKRRVEIDNAAKNIHTKATAASMLLEKALAICVEEQAQTENVKRIVNEQEMIILRHEEKLRRLKSLHNSVVVELKENLEKVELLEEFCTSWKTTCEELKSEIEQLTNEKIRGAHAWDKLVIEYNAATQHIKKLKERNTKHARYQERKDLEIETLKAKVEHNSDTVVALETSITQLRSELPSCLKEAFSQYTLNMGVQMSTCESHVIEHFSPAAIETQENVRKCQQLMVEYKATLPWFAQILSTIASHMEHLPDRLYTHQGRIKDVDTASLLRRTKKIITELHKKLDTTLVKDRRIIDNLHQELDTQLKGSRETVERLHNDLEKKDGTIDVVKSNLNDKILELQIKCDETRELSRKLDEANQTIVNHDSISEQTIDQLQNKIREYDEFVKPNTDTISHLQTLLQKEKEKSCGVVLFVRRELTQANETITAQEQELKRERSNVKTLEHEVSQAYATIIDKSQALEDAAKASEKESTRLESLLHEKVEALENVQNELNSVERRLHEEYRLALTTIQTGHAKNQQDLNVLREHNKDMDVQLRDAIARMKHSLSTTDTIAFEAQAKEKIASIDAELRMLQAQNKAHTKLESAVLKLAGIYNLMPRGQTLEEFVNSVLSKHVGQVRFREHVTQIETSKTAAREGLVVLDSLPSASLSYEDKALLIETSKTGPISSPATDFDELFPDDRQLECNGDFHAALTKIRANKDIHRGISDATTLQKSPKSNLRMPLKSALKKSTRQVVEIPDSQATSVSDLKPEYQGYQESRRTGAPVKILERITSGAHESNTANIGASKATPAVSSPAISQIKRKRQVSSMSDTILSKRSRS